MKYSRGKLENVGLKIPVSFLHGNYSVKAGCNNFDLRAEGRYRVLGVIRL